MTWNESRDAAAVAEALCAPCAPSPDDDDLRAARYHVREALAASGRAWRALDHRRSDCAAALRTTIRDAQAALAALDPGPAPAAQPTRCPAGHALTPGEVAAGVCLVCRL